MDNHKTNSRMKFPSFNRYYTQNSFRKVCTILGGLKSSETNDLLKTLQEKNPPYSSPYQCDPLIMFEVIRTNPICNGICQKRGYKYWEQLVERCYDLEEAAYGPRYKSTKSNEYD